MEQQDYIKRQIEQIRVLIGYLMSFLLKQNNGQMEVGLSKIQQTFSEDLHIDIQNLTWLTADEAYKILESKGFDFTQTTRLIDLLMAVADRLAPNDPRKSQLIEFCKRLNTYLETQSRTVNFSFHS